MAGRLGYAATIRLREIKSIVVCFEPYFQAIACLEGEDTPSQLDKHFACLEKGFVVEILNFVDPRLN